MSSATTPGPSGAKAAAAAGIRAAVLYAIRGDLRYLSHRDELRMLTRAMTRAAWPLRYSRGYNPAPRVSILLPRSVGTASLAQWALVDLDAPLDAAHLEQTLRAQMPADASLLRVAAPVQRRMPRAVQMQCEIELTPGDAEAARARLDELLETRPRPIRRVTRRRPGGETFDLADYLLAAEIHATVLRLTLRIVQQRSAKPTEILTELGLRADAYRHRITRTQVEWDIAPDAAEHQPAPHEGTSFGYQEGNSKEIQHHRADRSAS